jgi:hypothetical protein
MKVEPVRHADAPEKADGNGEEPLGETSSAGGAGNIEKDTNPNDALSISAVRRRATPHCEPIA